MSTATLSPTKPVAEKIDTATPFAPLPVGARNAGITVYDFLAATAMQALVSRGIEARADRVITEEEKEEELARRSYQMANAMLRARQAALEQLAKQSPSGKLSG
jgi:hypothetical protein